MNPKDPGEWLAQARAFASASASIDRILIERHDLCLTWYESLDRLLQLGGSARLTDLATHVSISQPRLSRVVQLMEARGLVSRSVPQEDARGTVVTIEEPGTLLLQQAAATFAELLDEPSSHRPQ